MRTRVGVIATCGLAGVVLWVADALLTWRAAASGTFAGALFFKAPIERVSMRLLVLVALVILGVVIAEITLRLRASERELARAKRRAAQALSAASEAIDSQNTREELERLSRLSALILTWAGEGIFGMDERGRFTFANPAVGVMLGYEPDDLVGESVHDLVHHTRADGKPLSKDQSLVLAAYRDDDVYHVADDLFWRSDGASLPVEYTSAPLRRGDALVGVVVVFKDITDRKLAEANLRQTMDDLARSNRELEQFAYIASHDLQEPLRMVEGYMDLLARRYSDQLDDDAHEFIDFAVDGAGRMRRMIEDLLEYSRVGTRGQRLQPVPLDEAVDDALANLELVIEECGASITRDEMPMVLGDRAQLAQLYQNLIGNAVKFRGDEPPHIHLGVERAGETWRLSVADDGIGIAPEQHERIFVLFQRLHGRDEYPGTGIGLAVCRRIVERHGGKLRVRSEEGAGATFHFDLPVAVGVTLSGDAADSATRGLT